MQLSMSISNKKPKLRKILRTIRPKECSCFVFSKEPDESSLSINGNDSFDLAVDHQFIASFEICGTHLGLLSILTNRLIIDMSFSKLYQLR